MSAATNPSIDALVEAIDKVLPQTQCTRCGYPACRPYAEAIAKGEADFNQCPPGGQLGIIKLATLLGRKPLALNTANGVEGPFKLAFIDEAACIGCTLCIQACPVDAIIGAAKQMHTVIAELCTGCELCVAPCPVDCIAMITESNALALWTDARANDARRAYQSRTTRLARDEAQGFAKPGKSDHGANDDGAKARQALVRAAMERAKAMQSSIKPKNTENLSAEIEHRLRAIDARRDKVAGYSKVEKP